MCDAPLLKSLRRLQQQEPARFFMPGHKGQAAALPFLGAACAFDVTELADTASLYEGGGVLERAQRRAADCFGAKEAFFLCGGATQGLFAALLLCAKRGKRVLLDRNCHRAVIHAVIYLGMEPFFVQGRQAGQSGLLAPPSAADFARALNESGAQSALVTSPTYFGLCADIAGIAAACKAAGALLVVDAAHGAHFGAHPALPKPAQHLGAHFVVASAHKTLHAMGQSAFLFADCMESRQEILAALAMCGSSSPSYLMMASLEAAAEGYAEGERPYGELIERCASFCSKIERETPFLAPVFDCFGIKKDPTRLSILCGGLCEGEALQEALYREGVMMEMATPTALVGIAGPMNGARDFERLHKALADFAEKTPKSGQQAPFLCPPLPKMRMEPREAFFAKSELVPRAQALGRVAACVLDIYPPGVPLLLPGEEICPDIFPLLCRLPSDTIKVVQHEHVTAYERRRDA